MAVRGSSEPHIRNALAFSCPVGRPPVGNGRISSGRALNRPQCRFLAQTPLHRTTARSANHTTECSSMRTARPAARPPHPLLELRAHSFDMLPPCLILLDGDGPADPLVARERRYVCPSRQCLRVGRDRLSKISRKVMYDSSGDSNGCHRVIPQAKRSSIWTGCLFRLQGRLVRAAKCIPFSSLLECGKHSIESNQNSTLCRLNPMSSVSGRMVEHFLRVLSGWSPIRK